MTEPHPIPERCKEIDNHQRLSALVILGLWAMSGCAKPADSRWDKMNRGSCPSHQASCLDDTCVCINPAVLDTDEAQQFLFGPDIRVLMGSGAFTVSDYRISVTLDGGSWYDEQGNPILPHEALEMIRDMGFRGYGTLQGFQPENAVPREEITGVDK